MVALALLGIAVDFPNHRFLRFVLQQTQPVLTGG